MGTGTVIIYIYIFFLPKPLVSCAEKAKFTILILDIGLHPGP